MQLQGTPISLPSYPPSGELATILYDDFLQNDRRFEHWQAQRRQESCKAKLEASTRGLFAITRKTRPPPIDSLTDRVSQPIEVIDTAENIVSVTDPFPEVPSAYLTSQHEPALVTRVDHCQYQVKSDFILATGQHLECHVPVYDQDEIHTRLQALWTPRWMKHVDTPNSVWDQVCEYASAVLPRKPLSLPPVTLEVWRQALSTFKSTAATGPCGWTREDLLHLTDPQLTEILDFFSAIEQGQSWPAQWTCGLIHCLQKRSDSSSVDGYRPITVISLFYRVYAGIRAGQILAHLSSLAEYLQCGYLQGCQAVDVWYFIGVCLEASLQAQVPVHGLVADLVKAYNGLPRVPTFHCLEILGILSWFLAMWNCSLLRCPSVS